jgi:hypothetical protein
MLDLVKQGQDVAGIARWTWPHDSGHMWEARSPHPSYSF